jgi:glucokinase
VIVAGDIGGTHARLGLFEVRDGAPVLVQERVYSSREFSGLEAVLTKFVEEFRPATTSAAFGVAGPVHDGRVRTPNLPWEVDARGLASVLGIREVSLINDLEALAYGIPLLPPSALVSLNNGATTEGNRAVVAAGTGLGIAGLTFDGKQHQPLATEGGHADFAPRNALECELMLHLVSRFGRVSNERILSGAGLTNLYEFLRDTGRGEEPDWLSKRLGAEDKAKVISVCGMDHSSGLCSQALDLFASIYGAVAGNIALLFLATGGVYLGGGIAPKVLARLQDKALFLPAFLDKGRLKSVLEQVPVQVVLDDKVGMRGAAQLAAQGAVR